MCDWKESAVQFNLFIIRIFNEAISDSAGWTVLNCYSSDTVVATQAPTPIAPSCVCIDLVSQLWLFFLQNMNKKKPWRRTYMYNSSLALCMFYVHISYKSKNNFQFMFVKTAFVKTVFVRLTKKENIIKSLCVYTCIAVILLFSVLAVQLTPAPKPSQ